MITYILNGLVFGVLMVSVGLLLYHWWGMLRNIREEKKMLANFLAGLLPFIPGLFTEKGNYHRRQFGWCLIGIVILTIVAIVVDSYKRGLIHGPSY